MTPDQKKILYWLFNGHTGVSSKSLAAEYLGIEKEECCPPRDPADLGRCLLLIELVPDVRQCVDRLAEKNDAWKKAAKCWDEAAAMMDSEVGIDWSKGRYAPKTFEIMKEAGL